MLVAPRVLEGEGETEWIAKLFSQCDTAAAPLETLVRIPEKPHRQASQALRNNPGIFSIDECMEAVFPRIVQINALLEVILGGNEVAEQ